MYKPVPEKDRCQCPKRALNPVPLPHVARKAEQESGQAEDLFGDSNDAFEAALALLPLPDATVTAVNGARNSTTMQEDNNVFHHACSHIAGSTPRRPRKRQESEEREGISNDHGTSSGRCSSSASFKRQHVDIKPAPIATLEPSRLSVASLPSFPRSQNGRSAAHFVLSQSSSTMGTTSCAVPGIPFILPRVPLAQLHVPLAMTWSGEVPVPLPQDAHHLQQQRFPSSHVVQSTQSTKGQRKGVSQGRSHMTRTAMCAKRHA